MLVCGLSVGYYQILVAFILQIVSQSTVHLVKLIDHPTKTNELLRPICTSRTAQQIKGQRCTPVTRVSNHRPRFFDQLFPSPILITEGTSLRGTNGSEDTVSDIV